MKIVIDISEETNKFVQETSFVENTDTMFSQNARERKQTMMLFDILDAIKNGTPLPEHHGRLIDADALINSLGASDRDIYCIAVIEEDAPTIIEGSDSIS